MMPLRFHPDTKLEISDSFQWYQAQSNGLGTKFIEELEDAFHSIQALPNTWPPMGKSHRRYILSRFPYSVIYTLMNEQILVVTIMHNHRKPGYWLKRS